MALPHLFNLSLEFVYGLEVLCVHFIEPVDVLNRLFQLVLEGEVVTDDVADPPILNLLALIHLELVEQLSCLAFEQTFALEVLLVVVHFQLALLQYVLFPVQLVLDHLQLLLVSSSLRVLLVLHVLNDLREDQFLRI